MVGSSYICEMEERRRRRSHLPEVGVARHLGVLAGFLLSHQAHLAHHAAQSEAVDVRELPLAPSVVRQLEGLGEDDVVCSGEYSVGRGVGARRFFLQRVVVDAVVDQQHSLLVARVLAEAIHSDCLSVHHADLALVELGQDRQLDGSSPGVVPSYPIAVLLVGFPEHCFRVGGGIARHNLGDEAPHLRGASGVVNTPLDHVKHAGEEAGVVGRDHSACERGRGVQVRNFCDGGLILRLWLVLFFLNDECVSCRG